MITEQQYSTCLHAKGQFCKIDATFQPLTYPPSCIAALYVKNDQEIGVQHSLSIFHTPPAFTPITVTSNHWILIPTPTMQGSTVTMICPDKATSLTLFQQPFHIQVLQPAFSATSRHFQLPPHYGDHVVMIQIPLDRENLNAINISTLDFIYGSIWTSTGLQHTHRNWQRCLKFPLHNSTNTWSARVNLFYHLCSTAIEMKSPFLHGNS